MTHSLQVEEVVVPTYGISGELIFIKELYIAYRKHFMVDKC